MPPAAPHSTGRSSGLAAVLLCWQVLLAAVLLQHASESSELHAVATGVGDHIWAMSPRDSSGVRHRVW